MKFGFVTENRSVAAMMYPSVFGSSQYAAIFSGYTCTVRHDRVLLASDPLPPTVAALRPRPNQIDRPTGALGWPPTSTGATVNTPCSSASAMRERAPAAGG